MEKLKELFFKLLSGFFIGTGFVVAVGLLGGYAVSHITTTATEQSNKEMGSKEDAKIPEFKSMFREYDESAKLKAIVKNERIENGLFSLLGEISNNGEHTWRMIQVKAELFDKSGKFIEQCEENISQTIRPEQTINFKLSCQRDDWNSFDPNGYSSYTLVITNARYVSEE